MAKYWMTVDYYSKITEEIIYSSSSEVEVRGKLNTGSAIRMACHTILSERYSGEMHQDSYYYKVLFIKELK